jgi:hypothetical protein
MAGVLSSGLPQLPSPPYQPQIPISFRAAGHVRDKLDYIQIRSQDMLYNPSLRPIDRLEAPSSLHILSCS